MAKARNAIRSISVVTTVLLVYSVSLNVGCDKPTAPEKKIALKTDSAFSFDEHQPGLHQEVMKLEGMGDEESVYDTFRYTIDVPENYDGKTPVPLIFTLHFGGPIRPYIGSVMLTSMTKPGLEDLNAIIVAPDSLNGRWSTPENEQAILKLYDLIVDKYAIDLERTMLTGFSMGGHGTFHLTAKYPDKFRLGIPIAGNPTPETVAADLKTPLYVIHSKKDAVVRIEPTAEFVADARKKGADIQFIELPEARHNEAASYIPPLKEAVKWAIEKWNR